MQRDVYQSGRKTESQRWSNEDKKGEKADCVLISTICSCLHRKSTPARKALDIISVILTAMTSRHCHHALSVRYIWFKLLRRMPPPPSLWWSACRRSGCGVFARLLSLSASCAAWQWPRALWGLFVLTLRGAGCVVVRVFLISYSQKASVVCTEPD